MMGIVSIIALAALSQLKESFGKDLNYVEDDDLPAGQINMASEMNVRQ